MNCSLAQAIVLELIKSDRDHYKNHYTDDEIQALDHVNNCPESNKCAETSIDYYEKFVTGKSCCPATGSSYPNPNFRHIKRSLNHQSAG